jgi:hypothetical protein
VVARNGGDGVAAGTAGQWTQGLRSENRVRSATGWRRLPRRGKRHPAMEMEGKRAWKSAAYPDALFACNLSWRSRKRAAVFANPVEP